MVQKHLNKNKPSLYYPNDKVYVKPARTRGQVTKYGNAKVGTILDADHKKIDIG